MNHPMLGVDLMRIAVLAKIASDKNKSKATFAFIVVGTSRVFPTRL